MSHHASVPTLGLHAGTPIGHDRSLCVPKPGQPDRSVLVLNVHPSFGVSPLGPTTNEPFAPGALYEIKIDTNGDAIADITYSAQFASSADGKQTATLRRVTGSRAAGCAMKATSSSREYRCLSLGRRWWRKPATTGLSSVGAAILSSSTQMACSTTCSSPATISSRTRMFAASSSNCPTRLLGATKWDCGAHPRQDCRRLDSGRSGRKTRASGFPSRRGTGVVPQGGSGRR